VYQLTALYSHPEDTAAFDKHYREVHSKLGAALPGVKAFTMSWPAPGPDGAKPSYHFIATFYWDSAEECQAALSGPEGEAALADLPNFAGAGVDIMTGPAEVVV
jgi:uncharacterized protein (TIGR02118 family)